MLPFLETATLVDIRVKVFEVCLWKWWNLSSKLYMLDFLARYPFHTFFCILNSIKNVTSLIYRQTNFSCCCTWSWSRSNYWHFWSNFVAQVPKNILLPRFPPKNCYPHSLVPRFPPKKWLSRFPPNNLCPGSLPADSHHWLGHSHRGCSCLLQVAIYKYFDHQPNLDNEFAFVNQTWYPGLFIFFHQCGWPCESSCGTSWL